MSAPPQRFPLSPVQYGMLVESMKAPGRGVYVLQILVGIRHSLDPYVLQRALRLVVHHHPSLRTGFDFATADEPVQVVHPDVALDVERLDLSHEGLAGRRRAREEYLARERARGFELGSDAPPMRLALARYADDEHELIWTTHHAMLDGRSWVIVVGQLFDAYDALLAGREPELPAARAYSDYVDWRERRDTAGEEELWRRYLDGAELPTRLPFDSLPAADVDREEPFGSVEVELGEDATRRLVELAERADVSVHTCVQAAWCVLLQQASGARDVVFGTTRACRSFGPDAREMVGMFLNTLPLRIRAEPETTSLQLATGLRAAGGALRELEHSAAGEIRRWSAIPAGLPLFESVVVFENYDYLPFFHARGGAWAARDPRFIGPTPFPITLSGYRAERIPLKLSYDARLYGRETIERVGAHLVRLLEAIGAAPDLPIGSLPALDHARSGAREARFWARRIALLDEGDGAAGPDASGGEVDAPLPAGNEAGGGDARVPPALAGLVAFLARIVGDEGHEVAVRLDGVDVPVAHFALPAYDAPCTLAELRTELGRTRAAGAGAGGVALEAVDELAAPARPPPGAAVLVQVPRRGASWRCAFHPELVDGSAARALCAQASAFLAALARDPAADLRTVDLLTAYQRRRLLGDWNETRVELPPGCVAERIAATSARRPDAVAVEDGASSIAYAELDRRAGELAGWLASRRVGRGSLVGVYLERSVELPVALLGVLKSGAAFVPLDPIYPRRRVAEVLADAGVALVLTDSGSEPDLEGAGVELVALDRNREEIAAAAAAAPLTPPAVVPDDIAYVIYTSGSTGRPKGVRVRHRGLSNFLAAMAERPGFGRDDLLLAVTTVCFDIAYLELLLPLVVGGRVRICPADVAADGFALRELVEATAPTVMQATPATWKMLVAAGWRGDSRLTALCGGEALSRELADDLLERAGAVWNMYGPTETTIWSTVERVEHGGPVLLGRPIANTRVYVLDPRGQPCPPGLPGELHIGGDGVAAGYLGRPELTRERFVPDPVDPDGARVYRTGDVVRQLADGRLEYLGRQDDQVKVNGYRIELGEVEAAIRDLPEAADAAVVARDGPAGGRRLVAYVVAGDGRPPTAVELRRRLSERLPDYMVPSAFVGLPRLPLTPNGKIDRGALPDPRVIAPLADAAQTPPRSELERRIASVWRDLLGVDRIGVTQSFFDAGGDSLLVMALVERLGAELGATVTHLDVFEHPTVRAMAEHLAAGDGDGSRPPRRPGPRSPATRAAQLAALGARRRAGTSGLRR